YQALAEGLYSAAGLDVTLRPGGPQVNTQQLLMGGAIDMALSANSFEALNAAQENLPFVAIAAFYQKDPQIIISHPEAGYKTLANVVMVSKKMVAEKPDVIQRFVDASIKGWYSFLKGPNQKAVDLIIKEVPTYTQKNASETLGVLKANGILESGDAATLGI